MEGIPLKKTITTRQAAKILGRSANSVRYNLKALGGRKKLGRYEYDAEKVYEIAGISEAECQPLSSRL